MLLDGPLNLDDLIDHSHPFNTWRQAWWMVIPGRDGGYQWFDLIGQNHGTNGSNASKPGWNPTTRPGGFGQRQFIGTGDPYGINLTNNLAISGPPITIAAWIKHDAVGTAYQTIFGDSAKRGDLLLSGFGSNPYPLGYQWEGTADEYNANSGLTVNDNKWYFAALSISPTAAILALGDPSTGTLSTFTNTKTHSAHSTGSSRIGNDPASTPGWNGAIDDVWVSARAWSAAELYQYFNLSRNGYYGLLNRVVRYPSTMILSPLGNTFSKSATIGSTFNITLAASNNAQHALPVTISNLKIALTSDATTIPKHGSATIKSNISLTTDAVTKHPQTGTGNFVLNVSLTAGATVARLKTGKATENLVIGLTSTANVLHTFHEYAYFGDGVTNFQSVPIPGLTWNVALTSTASLLHVLPQTPKFNTAITLAAAGVALKPRAATATSNIALTSAATRQISASGTLSLNASLTAQSNRFFPKSATIGSTLNVTLTASASKAGKPASFSLATSLAASAIIVMPSGGGVPGGDQTHGIKTTVFNGLSPFPDSYAEAPPGLLFIANGIDPMIRWDGLSGTAVTAGMSAPLTAPSLAGVGIGTITGTYQAYQRFLDANRVPSNLSPVSAKVTMGSAGLIANITYNSAGVVTVTSLGHGIPNGQTIIIQGVLGLTSCNGQFTATVVDQDHFTITPLVVTSGIYQGNGAWYLGVSQIVYSGVATPTSSRVATRQIFRNLDQNLDVLYCDIETTDLLSTAFTSTSSDETLASGEPLPLQFADDSKPFANRFSVPPSRKSVVCSHQGRLWAAAEVPYTIGSCQVTHGSMTVKGVGTNWLANFAQRLLYVNGSPHSYLISSVNVAAQTLTLATPYLDTNNPFATYTIRPDPGEARLVYFSEPGKPEAWPEWNAFGVPEDSDTVVGLMVHASFLYVLERRHIRKFTHHIDPDDDGFLFLAAERGVINNRCWVQVEHEVYMLDEIGIHKFNGSHQTVPVSTPIQPVFQQGGLGDLEVNWAADQSLWHAAHDPVKDTVRWYVSMTGSRFPRHAICYNYRQDRWWIEEFQTNVTSSTVGTLGYRRSLVSVSGRRVLCLSEGTTEIVEPVSASGVRANASSATPVSITDIGASFAPSLAGTSVSIVSGLGAGQSRSISGNTSTTLSIEQPWNIQPDTTSVYQVGGVPWSWKSGWFRFDKDETDNPRNFEVVFEPLSVSGSMNVNLYYDHAKSPRTWRTSQSQDGISIVSGNPAIKVDLTGKKGYGLQRMQAAKELYAVGDRFLAIEMTGVQAGDLVRVYQVGLSGVE